MMFVYIALQTNAQNIMEDALSAALRGDKRKRKAMEKSATSFQSAFYLHAKGLLPKLMIWCYSMHLVAWVLLAISVWAICLYFSLLTIILTAVSLAGVAGTFAVLKKSH